LNDSAFNEGFNDVDLCLSAAQAGYLTVWTPAVQVLHPGEIAQAPQALAALQEKWSAAFAQDQAYNANLSLTGKGYGLNDNASLNWAQLLA
jgi:GT2 family glycosyltransferase